MQGNLRRQGMPISFAFLRQPAGFEISEGLPFDPSQSYLVAFGVGIVNTLRAALTGIILATVLGIGLGVARLSRNWLLARLATGYVELLRNVPLLLWLIFIYKAISEMLPHIQESMTLFWGTMYLSNRGIALAWPQASATWGSFVPWLGAGLLAGVVVWRWRLRQARQQGMVIPGAALSLGVLVSLVIWAGSMMLVRTTATLPTDAMVDSEERVVFVDANRNKKYDAGETLLAGVRVTWQSPHGVESDITLANGSFRLTEAPDEAPLQLTALAPVIWSLPRKERFNYRGGIVLSPEFAALLCGLVLYTASFIAEIVRAGILAVPRGQGEAAKALGFSDRQAFLLIIFPQALRVIIPPLINQYLNLTKNSSLAIAVGYPDLFSVGLTINNQTGQAVPFALMIMATYLSMSLGTSWVLNMVNRRFAFTGA